MQRIVGSVALSVAVVLMALGLSVAVEVAAIQVRGKMIKVGDTADYVFSILDENEVLTQDVEPDPKIYNSLAVTKHYKADGQSFAVSFARISDPGPYLVTKIALDAPEASPRTDSLSIAAFERSAFLQKHKPSSKDVWKLKSGGSNYHYSFPDAENSYWSKNVELSSDSADIRELGVIWHGESTDQPATFTKPKEEFLRGLLASTLSEVNADTLISYIRSQKGKDYPGGSNDMPRKLLCGIAVYRGTCGEALIVGFEK